MSPFAQIFSISDAVNRLPQFEEQVVKLENEEEFSRNETHLRKSFIRRCHDLHKQIDDHRKKVDVIKTDESSEYKKKNVIQQIHELQSRLSNMVPEREKSSGGNSEVLSRPTTSDVEEQSKELQTSQERREQPTTIKMQRRASIMYDDSESSDEEPTPMAKIQEEEENESQKKNARKVEKATAQTVTVVPRTASTMVMPRQATTSTTTTSVTTSTREKPEPEKRESEKRSATTQSLETEEKKDNLVVGNEFVVLADLDPDSENAHSDLSIRAGETLRIIGTRPDGWWTARNEAGLTGLVPKTFLRHVPQRTDVFSDSTKKAEKRLGTAPAATSTQRAPIAITQPTIRPSDLPSSHITPTWREIKVNCLGDALRRDQHLSMACHLTPRLSHSNLGFHDLHWNSHIDQLRKRNVRVSRLVRLVRLEGMARVAEGTCCVVRIALFDESRTRGRQIVSNVHTIKAVSKGPTWTFVARADNTTSSVEFSDFVVRSNYVQEQVVLLIEAANITRTNEAIEEKSLGIVRIPLVNEQSQPTIRNKSYVEFLVDENIFDPTSNVKNVTTRQIVFKVLEVPSETLHFVDSMPDVLLFNPMFLRLFHFFRRRAGTMLIRDRKNPLSAEMLSDPLLAVFPAICDEPDILEVLQNLWQAKFKLLKNKSEVEQAREFFQIFLHTAYCVYQTAIIPPYEIADDGALAKRRKVLQLWVKMFKERRTTELLLTQKTKPVNIFSYSFDLLASHAID